MAVPAIELDEVTKDFYPEWGGTVIRAVDRLSLRVEAGKVFGLLGPNGSGKSTTLKIVLGLLRPTAGRCRLFGESSAHSAVRRRVGYLPESPQFHRFLTGAELVGFFGELAGMRGAALRHRVDAALALVGLADAAGRRLETYSKGMLQRVGLAQALVHEPQLLILDEPTAGVDPLGAEVIGEIIGRLRTEGRTVVLCSHLLSQVESLCDEVAILQGGRCLRSGSIDEILTRPESMVAEVSGLSESSLEDLRQWLEGRGAVLESLQPRRTSLEALFLETAREAMRRGEEREEKQ